jgi:DNA-directed RNA polymerase sigma subunit (sigma70/sigma32)
MWRSEFRHLPPTPITLEELVTVIHLAPGPVLSPEHADIIWARYFSDPPMTFAAMGKRFGIPRERARQMEANAMRRIRHPHASVCIRPWPRTRLYAAVFGMAE